MIYKGKKLKELLDDAMEVKNRGIAGQEYRIGDYLYYPNQHIGKHYFNKYSSYDDFINQIMENYETTTKKIKGFKIMYLKAKGEISDRFVATRTLVEVYVPTMVEVEIPYHSVIYSDPALHCMHKCRTNKAIITKVIEPKILHNMRRARSKWYDGSLKLDLIYGKNPDGSLDVMEGSVLFDVNGHAINEIAGIFPSYPDRLKYYDINMDDLYSGYELQSNVLHHRGPELYDTLPIHTLHVGEKIVIEDFDILPVTCSKGFHFFKTLDDLLEYIQ